MTLKINNRHMRKLWLNTTGLASPPTGPIDVMKIIKELGFVQLDTIQNVARAHHHILWSRNQNYREPMLDHLLSSKENIFEHFSHDACVIPMEYYPMWTRQFGRLKKWLDNSNWFKSLPNHSARELIKARIQTEGPLSTHAFDSKIKGKKSMWARPPHKLALDYMWYSGELSTSHRENFKKFYDLSHRVIPQNIREQKFSQTQQINWLCNEALSRLGFGSLKDIQNFWQATDIKEVKNWSQENQHQLTSIEWQAMDGSWIKAFAPHDIKKTLNLFPTPTSRMRIINPFDPAIRDRARLKQLFGFDYKIEIFVPAAKRQWGYYVYPLLEGDKFVGRIEIKADRKSATLNVINFWPEKTVKWGEQRRKKLDAELDRLARFINLKHVNWRQNNK